jgi:WD40 repeat protein
MIRSHRCYCILCALLGLALAWLMLGHAPAAHAKGQVSFIKDVAPILKENCFACHDAKKKKGKLDMTTYENLRKGGTQDDPIEPGKSKSSTLYDVLVTKGPNRMPPKDLGDALPKDKIDIIAKWIDQGAKLDQGLDAKADLMRELRVRFTPPKPFAAYAKPVIVNSLVFTPDGKKLVVGGYHELTIWDANTGKLERRIFTRAERAWNMLFLPDGKLVVAGTRPGQEGDVRIYDINAGKATPHGGVPSVDGVNDKAVLIRELVQTDDAIHGLALSADGKKLAAGGTDRILRVWDTGSWKIEHQIENHADWIFGLAFSPDGKLVASASRDKTAKVWDLTAKESLLTFPDHQNPVQAVVFAPDGKTGISVGDDNSVRIFQVADQKTLGKQVKAMAGHTKQVFRIVSAGQAKTPIVATASADGTVKTWDPVAGAALKSMGGFTDFVLCVALSPDGSLVAGGSYNGEVRVFKTADASLVTSFNASPGYTAPKTTEVKK